jgi:PAP_fibrillin
LHPLLCSCICLRNHDLQNFALTQQTSNAAALKEQLYKNAKGTDNGLKATPAQKEAIMEAIKGLVKINPPKAPAKSDENTGETLM